jgi:hypothetical protein
MNFKIKFLTGNVDTIKSNISFHHAFGLESLNSCTSSMMKLYDKNGVQVSIKNINTASDIKGNPEFQTIKYYLYEKSPKQFYILKIKNGAFRFLEMDDLYFISDIKKENQNEPTILQIFLSNPNPSPENQTSENQTSENQTSENQTSLIEEIDIDFYADKMGQDEIIFNGNLDVFYGIKSIYGTNLEIKGMNEFLRKWRENLVSSF